MKKMTVFTLFTFLLTACATPYGGSGAATGAFLGGVSGTAIGAGTGRWIGAVKYGNPSEGGLIGGLLGGGIGLLAGWLFGTAADRAVARQEAIAASQPRALTTCQGSYDMWGYWRQGQCQFTGTWPGAFGAAPVGVLPPAQLPLAGLPLTVPYPTPVATPY